MKYGKTAVYTILKNELKYIEKWLYYATPFDYRVLLDTGSTDGSWELLQEYAKKDPGLIIKQESVIPWRFDTARHINYAMIPTDTIWGLSPDLDEYFSINTHDEMENIIGLNPEVTNIACDRLDIYSRTVRVGYPNHLPSNKIHLIADYAWVQPIYEHLLWQHKDRSEKELYSEDIYLIHDQDFLKKERPELYIKMLREEYRVNPTNTWCLWFLLYHFMKTRNLIEYIPAACDFIIYHNQRQEQKFKDVLADLKNIYVHMKNDVSVEHYELIERTIKKITI